MPDQRKPVGNHLLQLLIHGSFGLLAAWIAAWILNLLFVRPLVKGQFSVAGLRAGRRWRYFSGGTFLFSLIKKPLLRGSPPVWHLPVKEPCCP